MFDFFITGTNGLDDPSTFWLWFIIYSLILIAIFTIFIQLTIGIPQGGLVLYAISFPLFIGLLTDISNSTAVKHESWLGERTPREISELDINFIDSQSQGMYCSETNFIDIDKTYSPDEFNNLLIKNKSIYYIITSKLEERGSWQNNVHYIKPVKIKIFEILNASSSNETGSLNTNKFYQFSFYYYDSIFNSNGKTDYKLHRSDVKYNSAGDPIDLTNKSIQLYCPFNNSSKLNISVIGDVYLCDALIDNVNNECMIGNFRLEGAYANTTPNQFIKFRNWNLDRSEQYDWENKGITDKLNGTENIEHRFRTEDHIAKMSNMYKYYPLRESSTSSQEVNQSE